jgi:peptidoglycan hydrolase-like protein with peptidoglycan-binding domain
MRSGIKVIFVLFSLTLGYHSHAESWAQKFGKSVSSTFSKAATSISNVSKSATRAVIGGNDGNNVEVDFNSRFVVKPVQYQLNERGYSVGVADGIAGPKTAEGISEYQRAKKLKVTGNVNKELLDSLGIQITGPTNDKDFKKKKKRDRRNIKIGANAVAIAASGALASGLGVDRSTGVAISLVAANTAGDIYADDIDEKRDSYRASYDKVELDLSKERRRNDKLLDSIRSIDRKLTARKDSARALKDRKNKGEDVSKEAEKLLAAISKEFESAKKVKRDAEISLKALKITLSDLKKTKASRSNLNETESQIEEAEYTLSRADILVTNFSGVTEDVKLL